MGPKSVPKPYIDSALRLDKKKFAELKDVDAFMNLLSKLPKQQKNKDAKSVSGAGEEKPQKDLFVGLREVIRHFNRGVLGAIIMDDVITKPSTAEHFLGLLGKTQRKCPFFVVKNLSDKAAKLLNINKISIVGIRENHPFLDSILVDTEETEPVASSKATFQKPTFTAPMGKNNKPSKKKKSVKIVKKKLQKVSIS